MSKIRKLSIGLGHPDQMMHYQIDKTYTLSGKRFTLVDIKCSGTLDNPSYDLIISDGESAVLWKKIINVPHIIEYKIDFE